MNSTSCVAILSENKNLLPWSSASVRGGFIHAPPRHQSVRLELVCCARSKNHAYPGTSLTFLRNGLRSEGRQHNYSSLTEETFNVSPCTSPLTFTRKWSVSCDALSS